MKKDEQEQTSFRDIGRTPTRGTVNGIVLGGVVGVLTGGAGLALGALGGLIGHHQTTKKQAANVMPDQLNKVAGSMGPNTSALIAVVKGEPKSKSIEVLKAEGESFFEAIVPQDTTKELDTKLMKHIQLY